MYIGQDVTPEQLMMLVFILKERALLDCGNYYAFDLKQSGSLFGPIKTFVANFKSYSVGIVNTLNKPVQIVNYHPYYNDINEINYYATVLSEFVSIRNFLGHLTNLIPGVDYCRIDNRILYAKKGNQYVSIPVDSFGILVQACDTFNLLDGMRL